MRIIRDFESLDDPKLVSRPSVATIGNFDGVHLGHQKLLGRVVASARSLGATAAAITFEPHTLKVVAPDRAPRLLSTGEQKAKLIEKAGIDLLIVLPFNRDLARLSPVEFAENVLGRRLHPVLVLVGPNFRFGHRHSGDVETLARLGKQQGFRVEEIPMLRLRGEPVSSSRVRELVAEGRVGIAGRLLGRPYSSTGAIISGMGVGRKETVPTLNLSPIEEQLPKAGVYITRTRVGETLHESVTNVGTKPTFGAHQLTVESFLLGFTGRAHGTTMEVEYLRRLRDEIKFPNPSTLKAQIMTDVGRAIRFFHLFNIFKRSGTTGSDL